MENNSKSTAISLEPFKFKVWAYFLIYFKDQLFINVKTS